MSVLAFFKLCEDSCAGEAIRASLWLFPVIESFHLLALAVIGGAVLLLDLRLLGLGIEGQTPASLWRDTRPWLGWSLAVMVASGLLLFTSEATKLYYHGAFWVKMASLLLAVLFTFTIVRKVAQQDDGAPLKRAIVALVSLALWTGVGVGGRWIGFS